MNKRKKRIQKRLEAIGRQHASLAEEADALREELQEAEELEAGFTRVKEFFKQF